MIHLSREAGFKVWDSFWDETEDEFFKVEDIQDYSGEEDEEWSSSWSLWRRGAKEASLAAIRVHKNEWAEQMGVRLFRKIRVHVVDEPFTENLKWEIEHYKLVNIPLADEQVYLVNRKDVPGYNLGDFMMFDEKRVTKSNYSKSGRLESMDIYENEPIQEFMAAKELLMRHAKEISL